MAHSLAPQLVESSDPYSSVNAVLCNGRPACTTYELNAETAAAGHMHAWYTPVRVAVEAVTTTVITTTLQ